MDSLKCQNREDVPSFHYNQSVVTLSKSPILLDKISRINVALKSSINAIVFISYLDFGFRFSALSCKALDILHASAQQEWKWKTVSSTFHKWFHRRCFVTDFRLDVQSTGFLKMIDTSFSYLQNPGRLG